MQEGWRRILLYQILGNSDKGFKNTVIVPCLGILLVSKLVLAALFLWPLCQGQGQIKVRWNGKDIFKKCRHYTSNFSFWRDLHSRTSNLRPWDLTKVRKRGESRALDFNSAAPLSDEYVQATDTMWNFLSIHTHNRNHLSNPQSTRLLVLNSGQSFFLLYLNK